MKNRKIRFSEIKISIPKPEPKSQRHRIKVSEIKVVDKGCDGFD